MDRTEWLVGGGLVILLVGCLFMMCLSENREMADFSARCLAAGEIAEKCKLLAEVKRSADDASMAASFAVGFAATRGAR